MIRLLNELRIRHAWSVIEQGKRNREKRARRIVLSNAQQMRKDMGLPPDNRLAS